MKKRKFQISPELAGFLFVCVSLREWEFLSELLLAVALHEVGHLTAAVFLRIPIRRMTFSLFGARIYPGEKILSYSEEWLFSLGGPLASFFAAGVGGLFWNGFLQSFDFSCISLLLGLLNLLPVGSFDGGRMLFCAVSRQFGENVGEAVLDLTSFFFLFLLFSFSAYLLLKTGGGLLPWVFSLSLLLRLLTERKSEETRGN